MYDPANEVRRIHLPRTPVNKGKNKGQSCVITPALLNVSSLEPPSRRAHAIWQESSLGNAAEDGRAQLSREAEAAGRRRAGYRLAANRVTGNAALGAALRFRKGAEAYAGRRLAAARVTRNKATAAGAALLSRGAGNGLASN
jgi:hypothetical protein